MDNKLVPVDVNKRPSPKRFIKNGVTLLLSAVSTKGFKKLTKSDTNLLISMINGNLIAYNEKNGRPLTDADIHKIQERFNELDVYTFKGESWYKQIKNNIIEKVRDKKLAGRDMRGFVFTPTGVLMIHEEEWQNYKDGKKVEEFIKVITHEGFHFLTNQRNNNMSKMGERLTTEGADESFIVKTFDNGRESVIQRASGYTGLTQFNFYSRTPYGYSAAVSLINMLGTALNINPEVSALKNDGKFVDAVKQRYGEAFYKRLIKATNYMVQSEVGNNKKNEAAFHMRVQNFVLKAIRDDIVENSKNPQDAVRKLRAFQAAEEWSARIVLIDDEAEVKKQLPKKKLKLKVAKKVRKMVLKAKECLANLKKKEPIKHKYTHEADRSFEFYYRQTYARVIERLKERGYTEVEQQLIQCRYRPIQFKKLKPIELEENEKGQQEKTEEQEKQEQQFVRKTRDLLIFAKEFYGMEKERVVTQEHFQNYRRLSKEQREKREATEQAKKRIRIPEPTNIPDPPPRQTQRQQPKPALHMPPRPGSQQAQHGKPISQWQQSIRIPEPTNIPEPPPRPKRSDKKNRDDDYLDF